MTDPAVEAAQRAWATWIETWATAQQPYFSLAVAAAREALKPIRELIEDARTWTPYNTRDIGSAYLAETVEDLLDELAKLAYPESELT